MRNRYNFDNHAAQVLAESLVDPKERCRICGIPAWLIWLFHAQGGPFVLGTKQNNRRLNIDHIIAGSLSTLENVRLLCAACNIYRGPSEKSDMRVLRWMRRKWQWLIPVHLLWWLNTRPGQGGRLHRNETCELREIRLEDLRGREW